MRSGRDGPGELEGAAWWMLCFEVFKISVINPLREITEYCRSCAVPAGRIAAAVYRSVNPGEQQDPSLSCPVQNASSLPEIKSGSVKSSV